MNREIKEVEYDDLKCFGNSNAVCPYCGNENYIEPESYKRQDEKTIEECSNCGKTFVHTIGYSITFSSEPYENWFLRQKRSLEDVIKNYKDEMEKAPVDSPTRVNKEYYQGIIDYYHKKLDELLKEAEEVLSDEQRN